MKIVKKLLLIIICLLLIFTLVGCGAKKTIDNNDLQDDIDNVQSQINDVAQENSKNKVGKYVKASENAFSWEDIDGGVAITAYNGSDKAVIIPESLGGKSVIGIKSGAFNSAGIFGVKLPNTLLSVSEKAFYYCTTLLEVYFGENITSIEAKAFEGCIALSEVKLNEKLHSIGDSAFANCQLLTEITLNDGLSAIGNGAFCMSGIKKIKIPGSVKSIGVQAFTSCTSLEKVEICEGVETIEKKAFEACSDLKEIILPASLINIGIRVFNQCEKSTIFVPAGSPAEAYVAENELNFKVL